MGARIDLTLRSLADLKGANELQNKLREIDKELQNTFPIEATFDVEGAMRSTKALQQAIQQAYDPKFNTLSFDKFNKSLESNHTNLQKVVQDLMSMGTSGQVAVGQLSATFGQMGTTIKKTNKFLDEMATTMKNTVKWGISSGIWNEMLSSTQKAYGYVKNLDTALNDIRIVTGQSAEQMRTFSKEANEAAKNLAVSTRDYTEGALIYYQQGLDDDTVKALTDITAKTANVTGQSMSEVSEQLTAVWNGYNVANEAAEKGFGIYEEYVDKLAAVGAATASDLEELATAMSKVASSASMMGVDIDQLSSQVATIVSVTRQAPESVGTALKTIYARMGDLQVDGVDEFGTTLGEVSGTLESVGIKVTDETGNLRQMGTVMEEVAEKWQGWTEAQRQAIAVAMAGKRQYNNLTALFNNWDMYEDTLQVSQNAAGTLQEQQETALESLDKKIEILKASTEEIYQDLFDTDSLSGLVEAATNLVGVLDNVVEAFGGLKGIIPLVGSIGFKVFNTQLAKGVLDFKEHLDDSNEALQEAANNQKALDTISESARTAKDNGDAEAKRLVVNATEEIKENYAEITQYQRLMSQEEIELFNSLQKEKSVILDVELERKKDLETVNEIVNKYSLLKDLTKGTGKDAEGKYGSFNTNSLTAMENVVQQTSKERRDTIDFDFGAINTGLDDSEKYIKEQASKLAKQFEKAFEGQLEDSEIADAIEAAITESDLSYIDEFAKDGAIKIDELKEKIEELQNIASAGEFETALGKAPDISDSTIKAVQEALYDASNKGKTFGEILDSVNQDFVQIKKGAEKVDEETKKINNTTDAYKNKMEELKSNSAFKQLASDAMGFFQGLTGFLSAVQMLKSIPETLNDDTASTMDKILQVTIALSSAVGMLASNFSTFIKGAKAIPGLVVTLTNSFLGLSGAAKITDTGIKGLANSLLALLKNPYVWGIGAALLAVAGVVTAVVVCMKNAEEEAKSLSKATEQATEKANELKEAYNNLSSSLKDWSDKVDSIKDLTKGTEEYKQAVEDANSKLMSLVETNEKLAGYVTRNADGLLVLKEGYEDVLNQMGESASMAQATAYNLQVKNNANEIDKQKDNVTENIHTAVENKGGAANDDIPGAVDKLIDIYNEKGQILTEDIKNVANGNEALEQALTEAKGDIIDLSSAIQDNTESNKLLLDEEARSILEQDTKYQEANAQEQAMMSQTLVKKGGDVEYSGAADLSYYKHNVGKGYLDDETHEEYAKYLAAQWGIDESKVDVKDKVGGAVYTNAVTGESTEKISDAVAAKIAVAYNQEIQKKDSLSGQTSTSEESVLDLSKTLKEALGETSSAYSAAMEIATKTMSGEGGYTADDIDKSMIDYSAYLNLKELAQDSSEFAQKLEAAGGDLAGFQDVVKSLEGQQSTFMQQARLSFQSTSNNATSLKDNIVSGNIDSSNIAENEDYQAIQKNLDNLLALYPELTQQAEIFNNTNLVGTQQYLDALTQLQDAMDEGVLEGLKQESQDAVDDFQKFVDESGDIEVAMDTDPSDFKDKMDDILDKDYAVNVEIHAQAEEAFEDLEQGIENIKDATSKIGEGFVVAAEDIRDLNNTFPGILDNCEYLTDGTIKLSQESVAAAQEAVNAEVSADAKGTESKLKNQANELRAKQAKYQAMANAAIKLAAMENATDEQKAQYKSVIEQGIADVTADSQDSQMSGAQAVADNSAENGAVTAANWTEAYSAAAEAAVEFAQTAMDAQVAATSGEGSVSNRVKVNYKGGQSGVKGSVQRTQMKNDFESATTSEQWTALAESYQEMADSLGAQANDIEGMIVAAGALGVTGINAAKDIGKSKSKSGGSGSGSKKNEAFTDDEVDRYWSVNKALDSINDELDKLEDKQSTMSGNQLIESLQQENKLLDDQIAKQKEKQKLQIQEAQEVQGKLKGFGVAFKDTGEITNYEAAYQAQINAYNAAVSAYNAGSLSEAGMDIAKQKYEDFKKQIERYDTLLYDEMKETSDAIEEEQKKQRENNLSIFEEKYKVKLDFSEAERDMQDFLTEMENDFTKVYEDLGKKSDRIVASFQTYQGDNGTISADLAAIAEVEKEIASLNTTGTSTMFESISQAQDRLKELQSDLMDHAKDMKDLFEDAWAAYMDGIDQAADKFDDLMDEFDRINDNLEYQSELVNLIYGEEAYDMMDKVYSAQINNSGAQVESLRQQKEFWEQQAAAAKQSYGEESEAYQEAYKKMQDCEQKLNDAVLDRINLIKNQYQNTISSTISDLEKQMTGGVKLDYMQEQWDRLKESADLYMDATEKAYNTETFKNNVDQAISDTKNLKAKQKLQEFQEKELKNLREKKQLTQYDVDAANARLDILQKEIALEDAQNNKNSMKVTRNSEGNWSYQYVADEDDVAGKRQELLDSYKELYELSKSAYQSNVEALMKLDQEYLTKKQEYLEKYGADSQEMADLDKWYQELSMGYANEAATAKAGLQEAQLGLTLEIYKQDEEAYNSMTDAQRELVDRATTQNIEDFNSVYDAVHENTGNIVSDIDESLVEVGAIWDSSADHMIEKWAGDDGSSVKSMVLDANDKLIEATQKYEEQVADTADKAGQDFGPDGIAGAIREAEDETDALKDKTAQLASDSSSQLADLRSNVDQVASAWEGVKNAIQSAIDKIQEYLSMMQAAATASQTTLSSTPSYGSYSSSAGSSGNNSDSNESKSTGSKATPTRNPNTYYIEPGSNGAQYNVYKGNRLVAMTGGSKAEIRKRYPGVQWIVSNAHPNGGSFKTGGYTGSWPMSQGAGLDADNGKLAVLHQKELVLNASDTENILEAVKAVRTMPNIISSVESAISSIIGNKIANMLGGINKTEDMSTTTKASNKEENNVYNIVAEFPNANNAQEIEQALLNLKNIAAQRAVSSPSIRRSK